MSEGSQDTDRFAKTCDRIEKSGIHDLQSYSHQLRPVLFFLAQSNYCPWIPDKRKDKLWKKMDYRAYVKVEIIDHVSNVTMTSF